MSSVEIHQMRDCPTSAQMGAIETSAMKDGVTTGAEMMRRAGRALARAALEASGAGPGDRALVLCGPGNNGGDGYVAASALREAGLDVQVSALGDPRNLRGDAALFVEEWGEAIAPLDPEALGQGPRPALMIDAVFGTGLSRPVPDVLPKAFAAIRSAPGAGPLTIVAADIPSGIQSDTGALLAPGGAEEVLAADLTIAFHAAKPGHFLEQGPALCGTLEIASIGLSQDDRTPPLTEPHEGDITRLVAPGAAEAAKWLAGWARPEPGGHKFSRGHVLVLGGGPGKGGAARMAARAALRTGAGLVTLGVPADAITENAARLDAIMLSVVETADDLGGMLEDDRLSALVLGPGLGIGERTRAMVRVSLDARRATILDADALTSFADHPEELFDRLHEDAILTPHEGEFARLFPDLGLKSRDMSKIDAARRAADRAGCVILLKGAATIVASPGGAASLHPGLYERDTRWLATAGAGDTLCGILAGLAAHAPDGRLHGAAECATSIHAEAARSFGPGLIAEDIPDRIPDLYRAHGL
ncbi:NAD(P)H-hydrate dehydratase [Roseicyclus sp. F158]|uniref:Bifunctional NAD(P)H-hydrate repair enzyme n=1 Tax=Tropicimonas omnivorans TaxID=3075590 RepID=A0ABU3DK78_9RHOB|nr:NAD(P)H-hydrate dehydratase [Roseicyclus sp. F158]MDT0684123.1 NAD(P)H-hydrate dehydratase [Roseicyclus sp. F158]